MEFMKGLHMKDMLVHMLKMRLVIVMMILTQFLMVIQVHTGILIERIRLFRYVI